MLDIAREKTTPPTRVIKWIGIVFDADNRTLQIPQDKLLKALTSVRVWYTAKGAYLHAWQKLIGRLHFCSSLIPGSKIFLASMHDALSTAYKTGYALITDVVRRDLRWYLNFISNLVEFQLQSMSRVGYSFNFRFLHCQTNCIMEGNLVWIS